MRSILNGVSPHALWKEGTIAGTDVVLIGRHGREHTIPPTQVNYRANVQALKDAGLYSYPCNNCGWFAP